MRVIYKVRSCDEDGKDFAPKDLMSCIDIFKFCIEPRKRESAAKLKHGCGPQASTFRQAIVLHALHKVQSACRNEDGDISFWLKYDGASRDLAKRNYLYDMGFIDGIKRRERVTSNGRMDESTKHRNKIANGTVKATRNDDCAFFGWWVYGEMLSTLHRARRQAATLVFEHLLYLFVPWAGETVHHSISKKALKVKWVCATPDDNPDMTKAEFVPNTKSDDINVDEDNKKLYQNFISTKKYLQLIIEHDVVVNDSNSGAKRQRSGKIVKKRRRIVSLGDTAGHYIRGLGAEGRIGEPHKMLKNNIRSLEVLSMIAIAFREMIECLYPDVVEGSNHDLSWTDEVKNSNRKIFEALVPDDTIRNRSTQRTIFSVPMEVYKVHHITETDARITRGQEHVTVDRDVVDLLCDDEEDGEYYAESEVVRNARRPESEGRIVSRRVPQGNQQVSSDGQSEGLRNFQPSVYSEEFLDDPEEYEDDEDNKDDSVGKGEQNGEDEKDDDSFGPPSDSLLEE